MLFFLTGVALSSCAALVFDMDDMGGAYAIDEASGGARGEKDGEREARAGCEMWEVGSGMREVRGGMREVRGGMREVGSGGRGVGGEGHVVEFNHTRIQAVVMTFLPYRTTSSAPVQTVLFNVDQRSRRGSQHENFESSLRWQKV